MRPSLCLRGSQLARLARQMPRPVQAVAAGRRAITCVCRRIGAGDGPRFSLGTSVRAGDAVVQRLTSHGWGAAVFLLVSGFAQNSVAAAGLAA